MWPRHLSYMELGNPTPNTQHPSTISGQLSKVTSQGSLRVQIGKAAKCPDGEDVPVACVADSAGLVEDPGSVLL